MSASSSSSSSPPDTLFFLDDLITQEILLRLPTKSLYRFNCVCKTWRSLISNPKFVNTFAIRSKSRPPLIAGIYSGCSQQSEPLFHDFGNNTPLTTTLTFLPHPIVVVASHNGFLLCVNTPKRGSLCKTYNFCYLICNPLNEQWFYIPKPRLKHHAGRIALYCYTKTPNQVELEFDFKVVCFSEVHLQSEWQDLEVETYSSETGEWKIITIPQAESLDFDLSAVLNSFVYFWSPVQCQRISLYDMNENRVISVVMPPLSGYPHTLRTYVGVSGGLLHYAQSSLTCFSVWALVDNKHEWSMRYKIEYERLRSEQILEPECGFAPLGFHPLNPEFVLVKKWKWRKQGYPWCIDSREVYLYHAETREIRGVDDFVPDKGFPIFNYWLPAWLPSLRKPTGKKRKLD